MGKPKGRAVDPLLSDEELEQAQLKDHLRSISRSRVRSRRYMVSNRLRYMWVFTRMGGEALHGPDGRRQIMGLAASFVRALRTELGQDFAYWYSPELHPAGKRGSLETCPTPDVCDCGGHGWHLNFFVGRRIKHPLMKRLWQGLDGDGNGYELRVKDWVEDPRFTAFPFIERLRVAARYGTKYAAKDWGQQQLLPGAHRYELAQGFAPRNVQVLVADRVEAEAQLGEVASYAVVPKWCSTDIEDWTGPLCWGYEWTPRRAGPP